MSSKNGRKPAETGEKLMHVSVPNCPVSLVERLDEEAERTQRSRNRQIILILKERYGLIGK